MKSDSRFEPRNGEWGVVSQKYSCKCYTSSYSIDKLNYIFVFIIAFTIRNKFATVQIIIVHR